MTQLMHGLLTAIPVERAAGKWERYSQDGKIASIRYWAKGTRRPVTIARGLTPRGAGLYLQLIADCYELGRGEIVDLNGVDTKDD